MRTRTERCQAVRCISCEAFSWLQFRDRYCTSVGSAVGDVGTRLAGSSGASALDGRLFIRRASRRRAVRSAGSSDAGAAGSAPSAPATVAGGRRRRDRAHAPHDDALTADEPRVGMRGIQHARVDDRAREHRRLRRPEPGRAAAEIRARGGFRAVDAVAPLDDVEVQLEDARLRAARLRAAAR